MTMGGSLGVADGSAGTFFASPCIAAAALVIYTDTLLFKFYKGKIYVSLRLIVVLCGLWGYDWQG